ncbi:hypothetical protein O3794_02785 [Gemella sanguinis]|uniref:hypothetical protein n=1 Tax=Gemella sanguinis TaxID=84135 RepID=UPI00352C3425
MIDLYKFELFENGKKIRTYQDENIETIFDILLEDFEDLEDIKDEFTERLINKFFTKKEIEQFKKQKGKYEDIFYCIQDYLSTEEYKEMFKRYFNNIDKTKLDFKITELQSVEI